MNLTSSFLRTAGAAALLFVVLCLNSAQIAQGAYGGDGTPQPNGKCRENVAGCPDPFVPAVCTSDGSGGCWMCLGNVSYVSRCKTHDTADYCYTTGLNTCGSVKVGTPDATGSCIARCLTGQSISCGQSPTMGDYVDCPLPAPPD